MTVVDVYTEWAGPCTALQATLKKVKLEVRPAWARAKGQPQLEFGSQIYVAVQPATERVWTTSIV